ncbi:FtsB family cell division protein [Thermasporomyces composti]|uniref:FtsB family cell division protein n=1 Tax=Thermasporomyces composti TaxID=696763 RepID=UPI0014749FE1|nr:septum formation initiator family protein [Thermasporomyces composti]
MVLAALIISYASSLRAWSEQRSELAELRAEKAQRQERVAELERELRRWRDPAYVEAQARDRFGWVRPGEVGYVVVGPEETTPPTARGARRTQSPEPRAWWRDLWHSVEDAGNPSPRPTTPPPRPKPATTIDPETAATDADQRSAGRGNDADTARGGRQ